MGRLIFYASRVIGVNLPIMLYNTRSELASLAHSFISVLHIIVHVTSTTFTYIIVRMRMSKLAHVYILVDHVTLQSASSLVVLPQLHSQGLRREDA